MTPEEYKAIRAQFAENGEIYERERERFFKEHPDCPKLKPIERLSLVMKREFAEAIIAGTKTIEIRDADSVKYQNMLYDKDMEAYWEANWGDELMQLQLLDFTTTVRPVFSIHFYNYNNTWNLDVECIENEVIAVNEENVQYLRDTFHSDEFDELLEDIKKYNIPDDQLPVYFYFAVGKILDRKNI